MCFAGFIIFIFSNQIVAIFSSNPDVINYGSTYLKIAAFIGPIYPVFISHALFTSLKEPLIYFTQIFFRMIIIPFLIIWTVLNIMDVILKIYFMVY